MKNEIIGILASVLFVACSGQTANRDKQFNAVLDTIVKNVEVEIQEYTRGTVNEIFICTVILADAEDTKEYFETRSIKRNPRKEYIKDLVTVDVLEYNLVNEKGENIKFVERYESTKFSDGGGLIVEGEKVFERLRIGKYLNNTFEQLKGNIKIRLKMPTNIQREIDIPVNISINDAVD